MDTTVHVRSRSHLTIALAAGAVFALGLGLRQSLPLFISLLNSHTGVGYATVSLAFGVSQLMWGVAQPVAGAIADRWGPRPVMIAGATLFAAAVAATPAADNAIALMLLIGVAAAAGSGAIGPAMLMSAANRLIPEVHRAMASGIVNAGGSVGQFTILPLTQLLIGTAGWQPALVLLGAAGLAAIPAIRVITRAAPAHANAHASAAGDSTECGAKVGEARVGEALRGALRDPSFLLLSAGFFACGFHIAFISTHLPGVVALCGMPATVSAWSLSLIGLCNILGSLFIGKVIQAASMKYALAVLYFARALLIMAFFMAPKTPVSFALFAAGLGFTYLSTVPPTIGLVARLRGARYLATLFGVVMLSHQLGGFLGAWLGGKAFEMTGSYDWMWQADIALCLLAAMLHLPIREARPLPVVAGQVQPT
ncbi:MULTISPECIES: MFS transporter [unclassified Cupriavidus]|uniref:MFS transporter n=1 Tax=unclassified Cupriavidus TaxID=2640874 RepID=UPI001AEB84FF|nr:MULTISPECIES: MFS transporter [unclassified Cupriavidus]MBP0627779.1 MFS transporter [Cupriavidus sp. AcVe19-1a]MBP0635479.1 MFS transporter [Cupriavidus sp. AcVe19-6a]